MQLSDLTMVDTVDRINDLASELAVQLWIARDVTSDAARRDAYQRGLHALRDLFADTGTRPADVWTSVLVTEPA